MGLTRHGDLVAFRGLFAEYALSLEEKKYTDVALGHNQRMSEERGQKLKRNDQKTGDT